MIGRYQLLQSRILSELEELDRTIAAVQRHWKAALSARIDQDAYINSVALNLHSFYSGLERIFELVAVEIDGGKLAGSDWRAELLRQMTLDLPRVRPALLRKQSMEQLDELRRFRHRVRNSYATNLAPQRMQSIVETLPDPWAEVRRQLKHLLRIWTRSATPTRTPEQIEYDPDPPYSTGRRRGDHDAV